MFRKHRSEMCRTEVQQIAGYLLQLHPLLQFRYPVNKSSRSFSAFPGHRIEELRKTQEFYPALSLEMQKAESSSIPGPQTEQPVYLPTSRRFSGHQCLHLLWQVTESQKGGGWKGPLEIIQSNLPAEAGSPTAGCTRLHPGGF